MIRKTIVTWFRLKIIRVHSVRQHWASTYRVDGKYNIMFNSLRPTWDCIPHSLHTNTPSVAVKSVAPHTKHSFVGILTRSTSASVGVGVNKLARQKKIIHFKLLCFPVGSITSMKRTSRTTYASGGCNKTLNFNS